MIKAIIDTNVFISGTLWKGSPHKVLELWSQAQFKLVVSQEIVSEYEEVFNRLINHQPELIARIMATVKLHAEYVQPVTLPKVVCRDPHDDVFIATALAGKADFIVSGDKDLLTLNGLLDLKIFSPKQFLDEIS